MIEVHDLSVQFDSGAALRGINLQLARGETLGIVGESGSGKSMLGLSLMGMLPAGSRVTGSLRIDGKDMARATAKEWRTLRARRVAMIFQEPMSALNPLRRVGQIVAEPLRLNLGLSHDEAERRVLDLFEETGLPDVVEKARQYPHELSGGQRQRVLIALALACNPELLIADEPTTALDAHVALRIIELLRRLTADRGMALIFISHDLAAVSRSAKQLAVMYGGEIVETGPTRAVVGEPFHPYTRGLMAARPSLAAGQLRKRLSVIPGSVPALSELPEGCRFSGRCPVEIDRCATTRPEVQAVTYGRLSACHLYHESTPT